MNDARKGVTDSLEEDRRIVLGKTIEYGQMMVRNAVFLNTGALVLVPSIVLALDETVLADPHFRTGFWVFVFGAFSGLAAVGFSFWAGFEVMTKIDLGVSKVAAASKDEKLEETVSRVNIYYGWINVTAMLLAISGMFLFVLAMFVTGKAIM